MRVIAALLVLTGAALLPLQAQTFSRDSLYAGLRGEWVGTLTYRDYSNDKMVTLPTRVFIDAVGDSAVRLSYIYDDGPGKIVRSREVLIVDGDAGTWISQNERDSSSTLTRVAEASGFLTTRAGSIRRISDIVENEAPAESRDTLTLQDGTVSFLHETRKPGGTFALRNELRMQRVTSPN